MPKYTFAHIHVISADPVKAAEFYEKNLGAKIETVSKASDGSTNVALYLGGASMLIRQPRTKALQPADYSPNEGGVEHIGFYTDNFDASVNELKANGVFFAQEPRQLPARKVAFFLAPGKVLVELIGEDC